MEKWYVAHTKPRQELRAKDHLERQGFKCFLPLIKQKRIRKSQRIERIEAFFPRYMFLHLDLARDGISPIRSTQGVIGLVRFGDRVADVPEPLIENLLAAIDAQSGLIGIPERTFKQGEAVVIETGSFAGLQGIFQAPRGEDRAAILLEILGSSREVVVARDALAPVA
ncbi:MAG: transcription/translation regulatory transformer protein RfaH [Candidatus Competibacteraceae bacterium]|jgi:transcriptional antiterminator RfaH|nr:transcription/translation regulatory transformer protein RfaH [Candidatus Competibacteraceae bacterium]